MGWVCEPYTQPHGTSVFTKAVTSEDSFRLFLEFQGVFLAQVGRTLFSKYLIMEKEEKMTGLQSLFPMVFSSTVSGTFVSV